MQEALAESQENASFNKASEIHRYTSFMRLLLKKRV